MKIISSEGDDERAAMHVCAWSRGRRASDEAVMMRTRHLGEDEGRAASQREEACPCGLGTKRAHDKTVPEVGARVDDNDDGGGSRSDLGEGEDDDGGFGSTRRARTGET